MLSFRFLLLFFSIVYSTCSADEKTVTQGHFAQKFAEVLGHVDLEEQDAINLLSKLSITPDLFNGEPWRKDELIDEKIISRVQASLQKLLKHISIELKTRYPPTLELTIFEVPPAPQRIIFNSENRENKPCDIQGESYFDILPVELKNVSNQGLSKQMIGFGVNPDVLKK